MGRIAAVVIGCREHPLKVEVAQGDSALT